MYKLLKAKPILEILDGDREFGTLNSEGSMSPIRLALPYLTGPDIVGIANKFGVVMSYGTDSRWQYMDRLLQGCIQNNKISSLLGYLFSKDQFSNILRGYSPDIIELSHKKIVETVIDKINGELYFGDHELYVVGSSFIVKKIGSTVSVAAPTIQKIDREYIKNISERALKDISDSNFDSAITKARTLLEESFIYVIEQKSEKPAGAGDIMKLFNQVKTLYNMHQDKDADKRINGLLSGLEKIVSAIAEMRNGNSDSHGVGAKRISISDHHARLFVNSAMVMADFILDIGNRNAN